MTTGDGGAVDVSAATDDVATSVITLTQLDGGLSVGCWLIRPCQNQGTDAWIHVQFGDADL